MANAKNRSWPEWYRVIQGRDLLFPENEYKFRVIPEGLWKHIKKQAQALLDSRPHATAYEIQHWTNIVNDIPPYGMVIEGKGKK